MNEDEMAQFAREPLAVAAQAMAAGVKLLIVTLGPRGAVYFAAPGFDGWAVRAPEAEARSAPSASSAIRTALVPAPRVDVLDPTGCGDVFGAGVCAGLLAGRPPESAIAAANLLAARNASLRGASRLGRLLRGELATAGGPS